jgi:hypothetical protein
MPLSSWVAVLIISVGNALVSQLSNSPKNETLGILLMTAGIAFFGSSFVLAEGPESIPNLCP